MQPTQLGKFFENDPLYIITGKGKLCSLVEFSREILFSGRAEVRSLPRQQMHKLSRRFACLSPVESIVGFSTTASEKNLRKRGGRRGRIAQNDNLREG